MPDLNSYTETIGFDHHRHNIKRLRKLAKSKKFKEIKKKMNQYYVNINLQRETYKSKAKETLIIIKDVLKQESIETKVMFETYQRFTKGDATQKEMEEANEQFRDVLRGVGLGVIVILPFSPITIPLIVKLGKKLGIEVFPSSVKDQMGKDK